MPAEAEPARDSVTPVARLLAVAVVIVLSVAACGPEEDDGTDLSRFAAVTQAVPPAAGR